VDLQAHQGLSESEKLNASKYKHKNRNLNQKREAIFKEYEQLMKVRIDWNWNKNVVLGWSQSAEFYILPEVQAISYTVRTHRAQRKIFTPS
jgi:hypothetical protein